MQVLVLVQDVAEGPLLLEVAVDVEPLLVDVRVELLLVDVLLPLVDVRVELLLVDVLLPLVVDVGVGRVKIPGTQYWGRHEASPFMFCHFRLWVRKFYCFREDLIPFFLNGK